MIKTLASLLTIYQFTNGQPFVPAIPAVPTEPAIPVDPVTPVDPLTPVDPVVPAEPNVVLPTDAPLVPTEPTRPLLPPGQFYGSFGQVCAPDPIRDVVCKAAGQMGTEQYAGFMKCERGFDCCLCGAISCGNTFRGCNTFSAGDSGVKGVKDITIIGRSHQLGGGAINCIGIEGCKDAKITGTNIKSLDAAGVLALQNAEVYLTNPSPDFALDCVGMGGCMGARIEILIEGPPPGYQCNPAIQARTIEFNSLQCGGEESCRDTEIIINNQGCDIIEIQQIECILATSCMNTVFNFIGNVEVNNIELNNNGQIPHGLGRWFGQSQGQGQGQGQTNPNGNGAWVPV